MISYLTSILLLSFNLPLSLSDFLGPNYPAPLDLSSNNSLVSLAWHNLTGTLDKGLKDNRTQRYAEIGDITFSVGLFSTEDPGAVKLQYHHTSPEIATASVGTKRVNGDSVYGMASVTKLFTVYAGLLSLKDEDWNRPLIEVLPGLSDKIDANGQHNAINTLQWDKITPWSLAGQLGGVPRDLPKLDAVVQSPQLSSVFPPLDMNALEPCRSNLSNGDCSDLSNVETISVEAPTFLPWTTPAYADAGFALLGLAISNITGVSMTELYQRYVFDPLKMTSTKTKVSINDTDHTRYVVAGPPENFFFPAGINLPSGGLRSTINDLAKFGIGILNSSLLCPEATRKWMKPLSHTASLSFSVGAPWEILRYVNPNTGKVTDLYTKLGDSGAYGGSAVLIPDYNAGITLLAAGTNANRSDVDNQVMDLVIGAVLPALEAQAEAEAHHNLVGTYISTDRALNSSVIISSDSSTVLGSKPGASLTITSWISNGTDVIAAYPGFAGVVPKLVQSIPSHGGNQVAFLVSASPQFPVNEVDGDTILGPFTGQDAGNEDWILGGGSQWGGIKIGLFVFELDNTGYATAVSPAVTKVKLQRQQ